MVGSQAGPVAYQTLILHWDGTAWSVVPSPNVGTGANVLAGVVAPAADDAWAVGVARVAGHNQPLTLHWDGTQWSVVPSPNPGSARTSLAAVAAVAGNDVWAVGDYDDGTTDRTLTEHWDGSAWSVVPSPNVGTDRNHLRGVTARAAGDVWAVGEFHATGVLHYRTLVEHWNGSAWEVVSSPNAGPSDSSLLAVTALAPDDAWAVGYFIGDSDAARTLTLHWDGTQWAVVPSPNVGDGDQSLEGVAAVSGTAWAAGAFSYARSHPGGEQLDHALGRAGAGRCRPPRTATPPRTLSTPSRRSRRTTPGPSAR